MRGDMLRRNSARRRRVQPLAEGFACVERAMGRNDIKCDPGIDGIEKGPRLRALVLLVRWF
jgi:hypothetical protein